MDSFSIQNYFKRGKTVVLTLRQGDEDGTRQWTDKDTTELLKLMNIFLPEFQNQRKRKKEVWVDVSKQLQNSGYSWTPEDCRKKWSNMIRTFKGIEEQKQDPTSNYKRVKWPFYDVILELLTLNGSDAFPEAQAVVQMLGGSGSSSGVSSSGVITPVRKLPGKTTGVVESGSKFGGHHHHQQILENAQSVQETQHHPHDPLQLDSVTDMITVGVGDHGGGLVDGGDMQSGGSLDASILFADTNKFKTEVNPPSTSFSAYRHSLAVRAKKKVSKRKVRKPEKKTGDEGTDNALEKFIETTKKQNEQMMQKMSSFHENALALMSERNELLREIRDSLNDSGNSSFHDSCHHDVDSHSADTLTLHMGPAFSTASVDQQSNSGVASQLNSTLVISTDHATSSALSTFQLEDGTVLSGLDASQEKAVLSNLDSFADSNLISEVSMSNLSTILHPTLVSVVSGGGDNHANMTLAVPANTAKRKAREK